MAEHELRARPLDQFDSIERASIDELRALQLDRLREAIARAGRVPHYQEKFAAAGIRPGDVTSLDDLAKFPFTTKEDLRQNYPFGMFAVPMSEIVRVPVSYTHLANSTMWSPASGIAGRTMRSFATSRTASSSIR